MQRRFFLSILLVAACSAVFAGGPENAVVVVNSESASSKLIANFYVHKRRIPPSNVIYLDGIPRGEVIKLDDFKEKILQPLLLEIDARKISSQIDYVIYSAGFPTKIDARSIRVEMRNSKNSAYLSLAKSKTSFPELSVTSATFLYQSILSNRFEDYLVLTSNFYFRGKTHNTLTRPFVGEDQNEFLKATRLARSKKLDESLTIMSELAQKHPLQMAAHYWLARIHAQNGDAESASDAMERAIETGWSYQEYTLADPAFDGVVNNEQFQSVLASIPEFSFHALTSQSFDGRHAWSFNGSINSGLAQGQRYLLSTMLSVTRNKGISEKQTLNYLERSIGADASMPQGTFYFTKTGDVRTKTRLPNFEGAMTELKQLGYASEIFAGRLPKNRFDILGLMIGTPNFDWKSSGSQIVPGAICDNLTSYGGWLDPKAGQTKLSEFLKHGAAGSSGTVREPFALQMKFPHPRMHVHYARGCTLAEAFYQAVHGPFQLLIVGDALCRPFAKLPTINVSGELARGSEVSGKAQVFIDTSKSGVNIKQTEVFMNGRRTGIVEKFGSTPFNIDTTILPDGYHEIRFVPIAAGNIAAKGLVIVPVIVNNHGQSVQLESPSPNVPINSIVNFKFNAPGADEVRLVHNSRTLAKSTDSKGQFNIKAFEFGRGTVTVGAVADFDGNYVSSRPSLLNIEGPISNKIPILKTPPKTNAQKPKAVNPRTPKPKLPKKSKSTG